MQLMVANDELAVPSSQFPADTSVGHLPCEADRRPSRKERRNANAVRGLKHKNMATCMHKYYVCMYMLCGNCGCMCVHNSGSECAWAGRSEQNFPFSTSRIFPLPPRMFWLVARILQYKQLFISPLGCVRTSTYVYGCMFLCSCLHAFDFCVFTFALHTICLKEGLFALRFRALRKIQIQIDIENAVANNVHGA